MPSNDLLAKGLDSDIALVHERFVVAMQRRLPTMSFETKERYFAVLSTLVGKLEIQDKQLREVLREMMAEAAAHVLQELGGSS